MSAYPLPLAVVPRQFEKKIEHFGMQVNLAITTHTGRKKRKNKDKDAYMHILAKGAAAQRDVSWRA